MNLIDLKECLPSGYVVTVDKSGFVCLRCGEEIVAVYSVLGVTSDRIRRTIEMHEASVKMRGERLASDSGDLLSNFPPGCTIAMDSDSFHLCYGEKVITIFSTPGVTLEEIMKTALAYMEMHSKEEG